MKQTWSAIILIFLLYSGQGFGQDTKENADFKLAVNLYNDKLYDLAVEQFRQFVALYPNTQQGIEARFYLGLCQTELKRFEEARMTFQNFALAFPEHPKAPEAWWNVAESYVALNNAREAALAFERVKTFHPRSKFAPGALLKSAEYFEAARDRESAKKVLRTLIQDYSSSDVVLPARLTLARMYHSDNQFELARAEARRVIDAAQNPELKAEAYVTTADALARLGKSEEAQVALEELVRSYRATPSYYTALLLLGSLQQELGSVSDALGSWRTIVNDSAKAPAGIRQDALVRSGDSYLLKKEAASAVASYERGAAINERLRGIAAYRAGVAALKAGTFSKAAALLRQAAEDSALTVDRRDVLFRTAQATVAARRYAEATRLFQRYRDQYPDDPRTGEALLEAARTFLDQIKDYRQALILFESAVREFPTIAVVDDALFGSAEALRQSGALEAAVQTYEALMQRFPASEYVERSRTEIEKIRVFSLKDKDAGLEKLALLIGDVIAQESKADLAFRLAEIYFHDLKDYEQAADQYGRALQAQLTQNRQMAAWYNQAKAYEYLALRQKLERREAASATLRKAIAGYDTLARRFPGSQYADDAMVAALKLRVQQAGTVSEIRTTAIEFLNTYPSARRKDLVHFAVAEGYQGVKAFEDAAMTYEWALRSNPSPEIRPDATYGLGESLLAMGARDTAMVVLEDYLNRYPNHEMSAKAAWTLGQYHSSKGDALQAVRLYQTIAQTYFYTDLSKDLDAARGDAYYRAGDFANAIRSYQTYLRAMGTDVVDRAEVPAKVFFNLASSYDRVGARADAKRSYAECLMRDQSSEQAGQAYYSLATIARAENNVALATRHLQEASRLSGASSGGFNRAAFEAAELLFRNEDYADAASRYGELAQKAENDSLKQYLLSRVAVCYFRLNNAKEADARAGDLIRRYPGASRYAAEFEYERGLYYLRRDDPNNAKRYFDNVIQKYSGTALVPPALLGNARVSELAGNTPEAIRTYESILQRYPNDNVAPRAQLSLGNLYYNQEKWDAAARQYKAIVDNEARAPDLLRFAMNNLILAYKELTLFDAALELTRKYIEKFPEDLELINKRVEIGILYQRLGYYDQAVLHLQTLLENADADLEAEVRYYIGEAYFAKGDYQQAILEFMKVPYLVTRRTKYDWVATSYYMAGQSYEKMSKFDQAITMYRQIMDRPGIDATFKAGAQREIDRVNVLLKGNK